MTRIALFCALLTLLGGCAMAGSKTGGVPDIDTGKADGTLEVEERGETTIGASLEGHIVGGRAHQWTFTLADPTTVTFLTSGDVDTVLYLHDDEGELAMDDDGGEGLLSRLEVPLEAGAYRVTVALYGNRGEGDFGLDSSCAGEGCGGAATDPWALARDVNLHHVEFTEATPIPESYARAEGTSPIWLSSPEWWQRWSGGATQSFSWSEGSDYGKRCAQANAIRLEALWTYEETLEDGTVVYPGREAFEDLIDGSGWSGRMYNWTEDVSEGGWAAFSPATMWAWRTGTVKFINVVHPDGSCDLPTLDLVQRFSETCLAQAEREDGAIQGCRASN